MKKRKLALIIGGSSQIGEAICIDLAQQGYDIIFTYFSNEKKAKALAEKISKMKAESKSYKLDLSNLNNILPFIKKFSKEHKKLDLFVNCASIIAERKELDKIPDDEIIAQINVIFSATVLLVKHFAALMKEDGGNIINISSQAGLFGGNLVSVYAASKGAVNTLTIALAREYGKYNIRVNAVSPGLIDTSQNKDLDPNVINSIALKRKGDPIEVAKVVSWLASDNASYINGAIIPVTGGR